MSSTTESKTIPPALWGLIALTFVLSAWGLFGFARTEVGAPAGLAVLFISAFDLTALTAAWFSRKWVEHGDSPAGWNLLVWVMAALSSVLQYSHMRYEGRPVVAGVAMACLPIVTVFLYDRCVRHSHVVRARASGQAPQPPAIIPPAMIWYAGLRHWLFAKKLAWHDRTLSAQSVMNITITRMERPDEAAPPRRREYEVDHVARLTGIRLAGELEAAPAAPSDPTADPASVEAPAATPEARSEAAPVPAPRATKVAAPAATGGRLTARRTWVQEQRQGGAARADVLRLGSRRFKVDQETIARDWKLATEGDPATSNGAMAVT